MIGKLSYIQIAFLYSPIYLLCLFYFLEDKFKPSEIVSGYQPFSIIFATMSLTMLLTVILIQSLWYHFSFMGISYSDTAFELFCTLWFGMALILIIVLSKRFNFSLCKIINFRISNSYNIIGLGLIFFVLIVLLSQDDEFIGEISQDNLPPFKSIPISLLIIFSVNSILFFPFMEEIVFRGLLFYPLYRKVGRLTAIILTSYFFMHYHFFVLLNSLSESFFILMAGIFLTWLYDKKKSLIYPLTCHMLYNATSVYFKFIALSK